MKINSINDLLKTNIEWTEILGGFETKVNGDRCLLKVNDFPDEPMYTLHWNEQTIDLDDAPSCWVLHYNPPSQPIFQKEHKEEEE
jgi:hypothetical protein